MKNILAITLSFAVTFFLNYIFFVPSSIINLLLSAIKDDLNFYILMDTFLSNVIFLIVYLIFNRILVNGDRI
jgi:hypothetical protein